MITAIKKIADVGVFKSYDTKKTGVKRDFNKINFIYAENTYGKSTLCDILKDASEATTARIIERITIPDGANQLVVINMSSGENSVSLTNGKWTSNSLYNKLLVFDTEFIQNNVFDGIELIEERNTKEQFSDFILGDEGVRLAQEIETLKREQRSKQDNLQQNVPTSQKGKTDSEIKKYALMDVSNSKEELEKEKKGLQNILDDGRKIQNNKQVIAEHKDFDVIKIQQFDLLTKGFSAAQEVLKETFPIPGNIVAALQEHIEKNCIGSEDAEHWVESGMELMNVNTKCPFCGQEIEESNFIKNIKSFSIKDIRISKIA